MPLLHDAYLSRAQQKLTSPADHDLMELMNDAKRFTLQYFDAINESALHVYYSALLFTPRDTLLRKTYQHELGDAFITVSRGLDERWSPCSRVIQLKSIVKSVAFSPDGSHCVSASDDDGVKLWSTMTGLNVASFVGNGRHPRLVMFTPDGVHIAAGYEDGAISVWDAASASGRPVINKQLHDRRVTSLAVSLSSTWLASTSEDTTAQLWDVKTGRARWKLSGHNKAVNCSAFSPDDVHFASAGEDGDLCSWNVNTGRLEFAVTGHKATITSVAFSPCGTRIASGSADKTVRIWDSTTGEAVMKMKGQSAVTSVIFSPDSRQIVSSSNDGTICCWDGTRHRPIYIWHLATSLVERLLTEAVDVDWKIRWLTKVGLTKAGWFAYLRLRTVEHRIITAFSPDTIPFAFDCYDLIFFLSNLSPHDGPMAFISPGFVAALAISSHGSHVASCTQNTINLWDTSLSYKTWQEFNAAFDGHVMAMLASSLDGEYFVILSLLGYSMVDCRGRVICILNSLLSIGYRPFRREITTRALFSPDSSTLAYWHESDHKVKLFSTASGRQTRCLDVFTWKRTRRANAVASAAFSPSSTSIACGHGDGTIRLWDAKTGCSLAVLKGHQGRITSIAFSSNGSHILSGSSDCSIRCWTLSDGQPTGTFDHKETITGVTFSPNNSRIIYASDSRTIWVWQTGSRSVRRFASVDGDILSLGFSNDGIRLFCRTCNEATYMWDFPRMDVSQPAEQEDTTSVGVAGKVLSSLIGDFCDYHQFSRYVLRDGWIFDGDRRVCWVPISYRPRLDGDFRGTRDGLVMRVTSTDRLVILRVGEMPFPR
jgi:WD40 repeat protein